MDIVIDTSSIYGDLKLTGSRIRTLCETAKVTGETICFPQVVIDEAKNKYNERLQTAKSKIEKELSDLKRLTDSSHLTTFDEKSLKKEFSSFSKTFDEQVDRLGIKILPYPKTSHEIVARKAVLKKKPFTESGKGYRDALIWENIKSIVKPAKKLIDDPHVVLITANHTDFCEKEYELHSDLKQELIEIGATANSVEVVNDFDKFIEKYCKPKLKILSRIKKEFEEGKHKRLDIRGKVEKMMFSYLDNREFNPEDLGFRQEFESPSVSEIHEDYEFNINEVRQLSETEIIIDGRVAVTCTFDIFIYKSDYYIMNEDEIPAIWSWDWNDHYFAGSVTKNIKLKFYLTIDSGFYNILSSEIEHVEE